MYNNNAILIMPKVQVTYRELLDSDRWKEFCDKYKVNEYCVAEGADPSTVVYITLQEAKDWGLIDDLGDHEEYNPDDDDFETCINCDISDACRDFGCAIKQGLRKIDDINL